MSASARCLNVRQLPKAGSKPVTMNEPQIQAMLPAIDSEGRELSQFAAQAMQCALAYGLAGILVDFPRMDGVQTLAGETAP